MRLELKDGEFCIDASLLGEIFDIPPLGVQALIRGKEITSICERGEREHEGQYRLTFFYKSKRARLEIDSSGCILRRSVIDDGVHSPIPATRRIASR